MDLSNLKPESIESIQDRCWELSDKQCYGICPSPIPAQVAFDEITRYILGDNWYVTMPLRADQVNHEALVEMEIKLRKWKMFNK